MSLKPFHLGALIFFIDLLTKFLTTIYLPNLLIHGLWYPYGGIEVFHDFYGIDFAIIHATNKGAAWGLLANWQQELLYVRIALIFGLAIYTYFNRDARRKWLFAVILAGALGNVVDYFFYGHVIDMLHFTLWGYQFPTFNIADTAIFIGIVGLFLLPAKKLNSQREHV